MSRFEDPIQFDLRKKIGDVEIVYSDLMEISQGGPEVGIISVNGKKIKGRYGGPAICEHEHEHEYLPVYLNFFGERGSNWQE